MTFRKVYSIKNSIRITGVAVSFLLASAPVWPYVLGMKTSGTTLDFLCFLAFCWGLAGVSLLGGLFSRIIISPEGIEHFAPPLYKITTSWNNVTGIERNPYGFVQLILQEPAFSANPLWAWYYRLFGYDRLIQLSFFVEDWTKSELIAEIRHYAPHIFKAQ